MVTIYNLMIDAASWGSDIPGSIRIARGYYAHIDPRSFFAVVPPINQLFILFAIILCWKDAVLLRIYFSVSFLLYAAIATLTFAYFVPRDKILFNLPVEGNIEQIRAALSEWKAMNWLRTVLGLAGVLSTCAGLDFYYRRLNKKA
jgi:hypothetical protein